MFSVITYIDLFQRRLFRRLCCIVSITLLTLTSTAFAQDNILSRQFVLSRPYVGTSDSLIVILSRQLNITVSYSNRVYVNDNVTLPRDTYTLQQVLDKVFLRFPVEYVVRGNRVIVAPHKAHYYTLSGFCRDAHTGEALIGASVYDTLLYVGQAANDYGFFSVTLPEGHVGLRASFVGYKTSNVSLSLSSDTIVNIKLVPSILIDDVDVVADEVEPERKQTSVVSLPIEQIKSMPTLLGEADVIKALECTPGVHGGEEGFGGMSVRGGGADQNIVMLDDVPLYSPNHLMGLYSIFNSESVNNATLIKGGFPARYGGRMSSVLDIKMKEGNMQHFSGYVNIGLLASNATFEGPIIKDRMSFIVSARRTYFDLLSDQIQQSNDNRYSFCFYDINAKLNYIYNHKNRFYFGFFTGYDNLGYAFNFRDVNINYSDYDTKQISINDSQRVRWGNIVASVRWNHIFGSSLFSNTSFSFSRYRFRNNMVNYANDNSLKFQNGYYSGINDASGRVDFNWYTPFLPGSVRFGTNATYHSFCPGMSVYSYGELENDTIARNNDKSFYRLEFHAYVEDEFNVGGFSANVGLHMSALHREKESMYVRFEPRLFVGYEFTKSFRMKVCYSDMTQFVQLLRMVSVASPADMWMPVSSKMPVPHSWQTSVETDITFPNSIGLTVEAYYKRFLNQQTYKTSLLVDLLASNWDDIYSNGDGRAKGVEIFLHRKSGQISGWVGYAWSNARNRFDNINNGRYFPSDNDRTNTISAFGCYRFNDDVDMSASWSYSTGSPITLSDSRFSVMGSGTGFTYPLEGVRNDYRMPSSHTLNVGVNVKRHVGNTDRKLSFGLYNIYARKNPMFVYWNKNEQSNSYKLKQFCLIAWPWPYVKYSIRF